MKIYVAGKWEERDKIRVWHELLKQQGHQITRDWTDHDYPKPGEESKFAQYAQADLKGVKDCDVFLGIFENKLHYRGALVELGAALALGKAVWIVGNGEDDCMFMAHPSILHFKDTKRLMASLHVLQVADKVVRDGR